VLIELKRVIMGKGGKKWGGKKSKNEKNEKKSKNCSGYKK
jgi:hypothetical protein